MVTTRKKKTVRKEIMKVLTRPERKRIKFFIVNTDEATATHYYGFRGSETENNTMEPFYIMRQDTTTGTYDYYFGLSGYDQWWPVRASLVFEDIRKFTGFFKQYDVS